MKPYLIVTHDYKRQSAGVRALHKLCHYLNQAGCDAFVTSEVRNPEWVTPLAPPELQAHIAEHGIVVYPEVEKGNRLNAVQVVRYLLNIPGRIRGDTEFPRTEVLFAYSGLLRYYILNQLNVLTVPVIDQSIFNNDMPTTRMFTTTWIGSKDKDVSPIPEIDGSTVVEITFDWPEDWESLAILFRSSELFISYQNYTALIHEARLCGCPTAIIPNGYFPREAFERAAPGMNGLAWGVGPSELERARRTVGRFQYDYQEGVAQFYTQLAYFIDKTQRWL